MTEIQALVHDVFGTVVDWRSAVTADGEALAARRGIGNVDWQQFADEWRGAYAPSMNRVRTGQLPWTNLDALHRTALDHLLEKFAVIGLSEEDKVWFNLTWHRLKPWPDSVPGLTRIKQKYLIATLSNGGAAVDRHGEILRSAVGYGARLRPRPALQARRGDVPVGHSFSRQ
jgi:2-haloacid dehalogenase